MLSNLPVKMDAHFPNNDFRAFTDVLDAVQKNVHKIKAENFKSKFLTNASSSAVNQLFESSKNDEDKDTFLRNFNTLFRETANAEGLCKVTSEISRMISGDQSGYFKRYYDGIKDLLTDNFYHDAIIKCEKIARKGVPEGDDPSELNCYFDIVYTLGCLYTNRNSDGDHLKAIEIFQNYLESTKSVQRRKFSSTLIILQQGLHGLALVYKNKDELHKARIYLERELEVLDLIQREMINRNLVLNQSSSIDVKYNECYSVLARTHDLLGNEKESVLFFTNATLAKEGLNYEQKSMEERENFVKNLLRVKGGDPISNTTNLQEIGVVTSLEENQVKLKKGEILESRESLGEMQRELNEEIDGIIQCPFSHDSMWRFGAESFDPFCFLEEFNFDLLETNDLRNATQELARFNAHYIDRIGE